jgi:hypothetical protein
MQSHHHVLRLLISARIVGEHASWVPSILPICLL